MPGLGKGLGALLGEDVIKEVEKFDSFEKPRKGETIEMIKITEIEPNKNQPRRNFKEESIDELATSIQNYGVIQPIIVTKKDNYFEIVAGERRWRASKKAGIDEMPCIVRDYEEQKNREIALIENKY